MEITLNGEARRITPHLTIAGLLEDLGIPSRKVAVERNRSIVPKSTFCETVLADGDQIEIVQFVGGG